MTNGKFLIPLFLISIIPACARQHNRTPIEEKTFDFAEQGNQFYSEGEKMMINGIELQNRQRN